MVSTGGLPGESIRNSTVHVNEGILFRNRVLRMVPHEYGWVPQIGGRIRGMEVFEHIVSYDPVVNSMGTYAVGIANACAMVGSRRACRVFHPRIFNHSVLDAYAVCRISWIGFDELRSCIQQLDAVNMRRLRTRIEDNSVIIGIADRQVCDGGVECIAPDAKEDIAVIGVVHAFAYQYDIITSRTTTNGYIIFAIKIKRIG